MILKFALKTRSEAHLVPINIFSLHVVPAATFIFSPHSTPISILFSQVKPDATEISFPQSLPIAILLSPVYQLPIW